MLKKVVLIFFFKSKYMVDKQAFFVLFADDVFSEGSDPAWMARLSLPLEADYHENIFVPNGPSSPESELPPRTGLNSTSSFSTFGKYLSRSYKVGFIQDTERGVCVFLFVYILSILLEI